MASQSLYRKWRSQTFGEFVGQEAIIVTLKNALKSGSLRHAYLFTGPRGTGKTSTARLLAKAINCTNPQQGEPCNTCSQCREITTGSSFNVLEIDAASNRGIDSIRELREKVMMPPTTGKYKVYILDEVHMLTVEAFNALLKTLEEPPSYAIFVLATTDVHKLLPTVLSRCQRFDFKRFTTREIVKHLSFVSGEEQVQLEGGAAELIARAASGGMRDALSLLDQAIAYAGNVVTLAQVQAMLGVADPRAIQKCISSIATLDSPAGLHLIHELSEAGADLRQINIQIAEYWRAMMLAKAGANIMEILDCTDDERAEIMQVAKQFALEELTECARIFAQNDLMSKNQGTPQLGLELALLSCIDVHRRAQEGPATLLPPRSTPQNAERSRPAQSSASSQPARSTATVEYRTPPIESHIAENKTVISTHSAVYEATMSLPPEPVADILPALSVSFEADVQPTPDLQDAQTMPAPVEVPSVDLAASLVVENHVDTSALPLLSLEDVKEKWEYVLRRVRTKKDGAKVKAFLLGYNIAGIDGTTALPIVVIQARGEFHYKSMQKDEYVDILRWALKMELEQDCDIRLISPTVTFTRQSASVGSPTVSNRLAPTIPSPPARREPQVAPPQSAPSIPPVVPSQPLPAQSSRAAEQATRTPTPPAPSKSVPEQATRTSTPPARPEHVPVTPPTPTLLARNGDVRENTGVTMARGETHQQSIEKHAKNDPVVKEVIRLFKAEIKDIQPK